MKNCLMCWFSDNNDSILCKKCGREYSEHSIYKRNKEALNEDDECQRIHEDGCVFEIDFDDMSISWPWESDQRWIDNF